MFLRPRDILTFEAIQRHWWLPSRYLHEFTKDVARNAIEHRKRLKQLCDEGYLERPVLLNDPRVFNDFLNYALTDKSRDVLAKLGKLDHLTRYPAGGYEHAAMTVAITANIELGAREAGVRYVSQEEILSKAPEATRNAKNPLAIPTKISWRTEHGMQDSDRPTIPDQLFGLDYGNDGYRFFAVEADRGTERVESSTLKGNSILRKLLSYRNIIFSKTHTKHFGIPNLFVLFVTTSPTRENNMLDLALKIEKDGFNNFLFHNVPGFDVYFRSPPLLPQLWNEPYRRAGKPPFDISKP